MRKSLRNKETITRDVLSAVHGSKTIHLGGRNKHKSILTYGRILKTRLMRAANMSTYAFDREINELRQKKCIETEFIGRCHFVQITPVGINFLLDLQDKISGAA